MLKQCLRIFTIACASQSHIIIQKNSMKILNNLKFITISSHFYNDNSLNTKNNTYRESVAHLLADELNIHTKQVDELLKRDAKIINDLDISQIKRIINVWKSFKLNNELIKNYLEIFQLNEDTLRNKLEIIKKLDLENLSDGLPLIRITDDKLESILSHRECFKSRIYYVADKLNKSPDVVANSMSKQSFTYTLDLDHFKRALDTLLEYGVSPDNILNDWWAVKRSPKKIKERLEKSKEAGAKKLMPWMVTCIQRVFQRFLFNISNIKKDLHGGKKTQLTYLAEKLKCSSLVIKGMCKTFPNLENVRVSKINEIYEFLHQLGFTNDDIIKAPKVFAHSKATIASRLEQIRRLGVKTNNLNYVCKSEKQFKSLLRKMQIQEINTEE